VSENSSSSVWAPRSARWSRGNRSTSVAGGHRATARHAEARARAWARTELDTAAAVADAYLSVLAADQTLEAAEAAGARTAVFLSVVEALVKGEIRPGLDAATARAEHAAAAMQVVLARRARDAARALLAQYVGDAASGELVVPPAPASATATPDQPPADHPVLIERQSAADEAAARLHEARRSADPTVAVQGTVYGRGTGVLDDNSSGSGADGLGLESYNWAVGVTVAVPLMELANKGARETVEQLRLQAASARREDAARELSRRLQVARQDEQAARDVAVQAQVVVEAARAVDAQATARYKAGLSSMTDVADAQRRLAQAEIDAALAGLAIWRARLAVVAATSNGVAPFLNALP
jgi:outer membrane protein TolC